MVVFYFVGRRTSQATHSVRTALLSLHSDEEFFGVNVIVDGDGGNILVLWMSVSDVMDDAFSLLSRGCLPDGRRGLKGGAVLLKDSPS